MTAVRRSGRRAPLLEVEDLVTQLSVPRGHPRHVQRRPRLTVHAVDGVSFSVGEGEMVALVASRLRQDEHRPDGDPHGRGNAGSIRFRGREIARPRSRDLRPFRREIQIIYQDPYESLDPRFTVRDTIEEPLGSTASAIGGRRARRRCTRRWSGPG